MKKTLKIIIPTLVIAFLSFFTYSTLKKEPSKKEKLRIQSAHMIREALLSGKLQPENVSSGYLYNHKYLDPYTLVYLFKGNNQNWQCAIGPIHPTYGAGIMFDSGGKIEIYKEKDFINNKPYLKRIERNKTNTPRP